MILNNMSIFLVPDDLPYKSKTKSGLCKNKGCRKPRRESSAYCQKCSDAHKKTV